MAISKPYPILAEAFNLGAWVISASFFYNSKCSMAVLLKDEFDVTARLPLIK